MFKLARTTIVALAAVASIGAAIVSSTSAAEARSLYAGNALNGGTLARSVAQNSPLNRGNFAQPIRAHGHQPHGHHHHRHGHGHGYRPWIHGVGTAAIAAPAYAAGAAPSAKPCTCLTKEYTADKLVVFKDRCTKEIAAAPLGGAPQAAAQPQPGEVEPQEDDPAATK